MTDPLCVTDTPDGILLTPHRPDFTDRMDRAEALMRENRDELRKLAQ